MPGKGQAFDVWDWMPGGAQWAPFGRLQPWEARLKKKDRPAARKLFEEVNRMTAGSYRYEKDGPDVASGVANVDAMLAADPVRREAHAAELKKWDDKIAAERKKLEERVAEGKAAGGAQAVMAHNFGQQYVAEHIAPLEKQKAEWAAANPVGLTQGERQELAKALRDPSTWGSDGSFKLERFQVEMSAAEAVAVRDGGQMTSSTESRTNGSNSAGTEDGRQRAAQVGVDALGINASLSETRTHNETRSRTDEAGRTTNIQLQTGSQIQEVSLRAKIIDSATGSQTAVNIDRVTVVTTK